MHHQNEETDQKFTLRLPQGQELMSNAQWFYKMADEVMDDAIILLDKEGIIQNWNKGAEKVTQYKRNEVVGKHFSMFTYLVTGHQVCQVSCYK